MLYIFIVFYYIFNYFKNFHIFKPFKSSVIGYFTIKILTETWSFTYSKLFSIPTKEDIDYILLVIWDHLLNSS